LQACEEIEENDALGFRLGDIRKVNSDTALCLGVFCLRFAGLGGTSEERAVFLS
jgi:hypothetical protein